MLILTEAGELDEKRIRTERERFVALFSRAPLKVLLEASTESEWVARLLESLGHEVVVADPNYLPMYAYRRRRVKTDRRDARCLLEACVEASWNLLRWRRPEAAPLWEWAERIAQRRGRKVAAVALARRLAGVLYAM